MTRPDMNPAPDATPTPLPLARRGLPTQPLWLLSIVTALSAAMLTGGVSYLSGSCQLNAVAMEILSAAMCVLILFCLFRIRKTCRWLAPLLLIIGGLLYATCGSFSLSAMVLALPAAVGFSALLLAVSEKQVLSRLAFIPLAAYGLSLILCRDPLLSLVSLLPFPAAAALAFGTRAAAAEREDAPGRVGVICLTSLCLGVCTVGVALLLLGRHLGTLSPTHLSEWLEELRTSLSRAIVELMQQVADALPEQSNGQAVLVTVPSEEEARNIVNSFINIFPGMAIAFCNILAALCQVVLYNGLSAFGYATSLCGRVRSLRMSIMSCVVFLLAAIITTVTSLTSPDSTLVGTVAQNISLILQPGLLLIGVLRIFTRPARRGGCLSFLLLLMLPFLLLYASPLVAAYAAVATVLDAILSRVRPPEDMN